MLPLSFFAIAPFTIQLSAYKIIGPNVMFEVRVGPLHPGAGQCRGGEGGPEGQAQPPPADQDGRPDALRRQGPGHCGAD